MSHSNRPLRQGVGVLAAGVLMLAGCWTSTARAAPPDEAPVLAITAPIVDIHAGVGSPDGALAVEDRSEGARARLDSSLLFAKDSARLRPAARASIKALADQLRQGKPGRITVTGYTDDLGSAAHGRQLSKRRADAVASQLSKLLGPRWPQIKTVGKGEADPAVPNTSERNRKLNRRVVVVVER